MLRLDVDRIRKSWLFQIEFKHPENFWRIKLNRWPTRSSGYVDDRGIFHPQLITEWEFLEKCDVFF